SVLTDGEAVPDHDQTTSTYVESPDTLSSTSPGRSTTRKRVRIEAEWKQQVRKRRRNQGEEYITRNGKTVQRKSLAPLNPCSCQRQCNKLIKHVQVAAALASGNTERVDEPKEERNQHHMQAEQVKAQLKEDKRKSNTKVICFDLQRTLPTPVPTTGVVYYKRQLWTYNQGIHDEQNEKAYMCMWHERQGSRGPNEIGSCLLNTVPIVTAAVRANSKDIPAGVSGQLPIGNARFWRKRDMVTMAFLGKSLQGNQSPVCPKPTTQR
ncbi:hypothetical protein RRG08_056732, partial [Elysia crispata]